MLDLTSRTQVSGNIGASIFKALVDSNKFTATVLDRPKSTAEYASNIEVIMPDYSEARLVQASRDTKSLKILLFLFLALLVLENKL
jgi:hypothetical protein